MECWIICVLALYTINIFIPPISMYATAKLSVIGLLHLGLGNRDFLPEKPIWGTRAARALRNLEESLFIFIPVAILAFIKNGDQPGAVCGAQIFFYSRVAYLPSYILGIYGVRSLFWAGGWLGIIIMLKSLCN